MTKMNYSNGFCTVEYTIIRIVWQASVETRYAILYWEPRNGFATAHARIIGSISVAVSSQSACLLAITFI